MEFFTFGYVNHTSNEVCQAVRAQDALLVDIRFSPRSRRPEWTGASLAGRLRDAGKLQSHYRHLRAFGNRNIDAQGVEIDLQDADAGYRQVQDWLLDGWERLIFMCVCAELGKCHRREVAALLQARFPHAYAGEWTPQEQADLFGGN
jgi:uncharacterized protein (DUF488 family)